MHPISNLIVMTTMYLLRHSRTVTGLSFVPSRSQSVSSMGAVNARNFHVKKSGWMIMWGEEERRAVRPIPSTPQQQQRQASGWSDDRYRRGRDENDGFDREQRRPARPVRRSRDEGGSTRSTGGWDHDDYGSKSSSFDPYVYDRQPARGRGEGRRGRDSGRGSEGRGRGSGRGDYRRRDRDRGTDGSNDRREGKRMNHKERDENNNNLQSATAVKTNLKQIESAGYEHLYGIAPVLNALKANIRDFSNPEDGVEEEKLEVLELQRRLAGIDGTSWEDDDTVEDIGADKKDIKPEAKCAPCLFVQEGTLDNTKRSFRSAPKNEASAEIISLAQQVDSLNVVEVDKGVLNTLCGNRPHQGFVLRCGGLKFKPLKSGLPLPSGGGGESALPTLWLALDEVVDPQNLGALLRSSYFLGGGASVIDGSDKDITDDGRSGRVGILVCSKNSSPLTPTVSAASAGALEFMTIYSTSNLPKLLNNARDDGWRVLGAAAEVPDTGVSSKRAGRDSRKNIVTTNDWEVLDDEDVDEDTDITEYATPSVPLQQNEQKCVNLGNVAVEPGPPTILVLGSEGRGLRTLVARACTSFVKIPGGTSHGSDTQAGVDSLNVSVTGGILLYHFLSSNASKN